MDRLYSFIYRGILAEASLDKLGVEKRKHLGEQEAITIRHTLSYDMLDQDCMTVSQKMSLVYTAIHAFENMVRNLVMKAMAEKHGVKWWEKAPERIQKKVNTRMDEDAKFRWHGERGSSEIVYCDFGDLSSVIVTNWEDFEAILSNMEWAKSILSALEKSRNIIMHGGVLSREDIERIGVNIRDWVRQVG